MPQPRPAVVAAASVAARSLQVAAATRKPAVAHQEAERQAAAKVLGPAGHQGRLAVAGSRTHKAADTLAEGHSLVAAPRLQAAALGRAAALAARPPVPAACQARGASPARAGAALGATAAAHQALAAARTPLAVEAGLPHSFRSQALHIQDYGVVVQLWAKPPEGGDHSAAQRLHGHDCGFGCASQPARQPEALHGLHGAAARRTEGGPDRGCPRQRASSTPGAGRGGAP